MFDHKHYVPILRWKQAEWVALGELRPEEKRRITPLVRILPESIAARKTRPTPGQMLEKIAVDMQSSWGERPLFVDLRNISGVRVGNGLHPLVFLALQARTMSVSVIPVTGLHRDPDYQSAMESVVAQDRRGACIRLVRGDLVLPTLRRDLRRLLEQLGLEPDQTDLLMDFQYTDEACPSLGEACALLPELGRWRTFTLASGAFPRDLTGLTVDMHRLPRRDWQMWQQQMNGSRGATRKPTYGDYGIYHPVYLPPQFPNPSASIRYTTDHDWVVMRGEALRKEGGPGHAQYHAEAQLLCGMPEFCGVGFSAGDAYIFDKSIDPTRPGNPKTWLQAGFNHHMTFVARQIANLFGS